MADSAFGEFGEAAGASSKTSSMTATFHAAQDPPDCRKTSLRAPASREPCSRSAGAARAYHPRASSCWHCGMLYKKEMSNTTYLTFYGCSQLSKSKVKASRTCTSRRRRLTGTRPCHQRVVHAQAAFYVKGSIEWTIKPKYIKDFDSDSDEDTRTRTRTKTRTKTRSRSSRQPKTT